MNEGDEPLLKMGTGGLSVGVAVLLASAAPAVSRIIGVVLPAADPRRRL